MSIIALKNELTIRFLTDKIDILKYLQIGISIPIWQELHKYILKDLEFYQTRSILLLEDGNPVGNALIYNDKSDVLYFGYFGVLNHEENKILKLMDEIVKYARKNSFKIIRGPINIPGIIYGWGFMKEGSLGNLFSGNPINPPIYQNLFLKNGFFIKNEQNTWEGFLPRINPWKLKAYDFSDYEYFNPKDIDDFKKYKDIFLKIQEENLPSSARITPSIANVMDNYIEYIFEFGYNFMIFFVRYKPTDEIVACGNYLPNPFRKDNMGNYDSCITYTWAVIPEHRRKGLTMLMYGATSLQAWKKKIRYGGGPMGSNIKTNAGMAKKIGGKIGRTHLILEREL